MTENIKKFIHSLPLISNCCYITENAEEKLSGGFFRATDSLRASRKHMHRYFAFVYLLDGAGQYIDHLKHVHELNPGSFFLRFPGKPYAIQRGTQDSWLEFAVAVPNSFFKSLATAKIIDEQKTFFQTEVSIEILEKAIEFIASLDIVGQPQNTTQAYAALLSVLSTILNSSPHGSHCNDKLKNLLEQSKLLLGTNLNKKMYIPKEIVKLGIGYESFRKSFTLEYGISPKAYRISRRLDRADVLLLHTDMSIKQIADSLGYPTASDFIRQYKKHRKESPNSFRKSHYLE